MSDWAYFTEPRAECGVEEVEPLHDQLGMLAVEREDNRLAYLLAAIHPQTVLHKVLQHKVDSLGIEYVFVYLAAADVAGMPCRIGISVCRLVFPHLLALHLLLVGKRVILYAVVHHLRVALYADGRHEIAVCHSLLQLVCEIGDSALELQQVVGRFVHLVAWSCRQPHQKGVEIVEDRAVFAEDGAVSLVDDYEVETPDGESLLVGVDMVYHRLVGGEDDPGVHVGVALLIAQDGCRHIGHQLDEIAVSLMHKGGPVGEEEGVFHPSGTLHHVDERYRRPGLARSGSHHEQSTAVLGVEMLAEPLDRHLLVRAVGNVFLHRHVGYILPLALLMHPYQVFLGVEGIYAAFRVADAVDEPRLVAVCEIDSRADAVFGFEAVGIEACLLFADMRIHARPLGLGHGGRLAVVAEEHIVGVAFTLVVGHSVYFHLHACLGGMLRTVDCENIPSCLAYHEVDEDAARFRLVDLVPR